MQAVDRDPQVGILLGERVDLGEEGAVVGGRWTAAFALVGLDLLFERLDVGGLALSVSLLRLWRQGGISRCCEDTTSGDGPWRCGCAPSRTPLQEA